MNADTQELKNQIVDGYSMELLRIPIGRVLVYSQQPRKEFDAEALQGLADSIQEVGQQNPAIVRPIENESFDYELIDGERRLRALKLIDHPTLLAFVMKVKSEADQFIASTVANFCRQEHTPIETAYALQRIIEWIPQKYQGLSKTETITKAAKICGRSYPWATQHLSLLNLTENVRGLLEKKILPFQVCTALTNLKSEHQDAFANHIVKKELEFRQALHYIRSHVGPDKLSGNGRARKTGAGYAHFHRFITNLDRDLKIAADLVDQKKNDMFQSRSASEVQEFVYSLKEQISQLAAMQTILQRIVDQKNNTAKAIRWAQTRQTSVLGEGALTT